MSTALILHPTAPDPYGVLTVGLLRDLATLADGFNAGWNAHREAVNDSLPIRPNRPVDRPCRYADLRDFILSEVDVPYELACAVALWMTREEGNVDGYFLSFPNVL